MFEAFVATFLEGLEAFLPVAVALAFFRKSRTGVVAAVQLGVGVAAGASITGAWLISGAESPTLWTWILAIAAALFVTLLAVDVGFTARRIAAGQEGRADEEKAKHTALIWLLAFAGTVLLVTRS